MVSAIAMDRQIFDSILLSCSPTIAVISGTVIEGAVIDGTVVGLFFNLRERYRYHIDKDAPVSENVESINNGLLSVIDIISISSVYQPTMSGFKASELTVELTENPTKFNTFDELPVDHHTDHMIEVDFQDGAWGRPVLKAYAPISLDPSSSVLHYASSCFEGMKAYKSRDGKSIRLFRPELNFERLNVSAARACLPTVPIDESVELLSKLLEVDGRFIAPGHFIYCRPLLLAVDVGIGLTRLPAHVKLLFLCSLMPKLNVKPLKLLCSAPNEVRAWPGGFGNAKLAANYGPTFRAAKAARDKGYSQVLWLFGEEGIVTEAGAMNFMAVIKTESGKPKVITAPLSLGLILPGITRRSALELLKEKYSHVADVAEEVFTAEQLYDYAQKGQLLETFAVGTAYFVAPIEEITLNDGRVIKAEVPADGIAKSIQTSMTEIMWGEISHPWSHVAVTL